MPIDIDSGELMMRDKVWRGFLVVLYLANAAPAFLPLFISFTVVYLLNPEYWLV